MSSQL